jgi:hypothetical protein
MAIIMQLRKEEAFRGGKEASGSAEGQRTKQQSGSESAQEGDDDLSISPVLVNILVNERQGFSLFDDAGHNLTSKAEWTLSDSYVPELTTTGTLAITAKDSGTVIVRARVGMRSAEASVTVNSGDRLPTGTIRWQAPKPKGNFKPQQIVIAVPSGNVR